MKKIFAILVAVCMLAGALCITAFAADPVVLRVSALKEGETTPVVLGEYTSFQDGWNDAMELAGDKAAMRKSDYERIVVDLYADWHADKEGDFTDEWINGPGFDNDTIYIPGDAKVTLNLNNHTINRGLTKDINDGEVMFINDDADVIINAGTITGGYSNSEGGGLYIEGGANVTLNNVHIVGNAVVNDDGAGIYLYGGATLTMNGGSVLNNFVDGEYVPFVGEIEPFGVIAAMDSTVVFNDVTFSGNYTHTYARGLVLYADGSNVIMNRCTVKNNAVTDIVAEEIIYAKDSRLIVTDTNFISNNTLTVSENVYGVDPRLFYLYDSVLSMTGGTIRENRGDEIFYFYDSKANIKGVTITDNAARVMYVNNGNEIVNLEGCTLGNNTVGTEKTVVVLSPNTVTMVDCELGDTTFTNREYIKITSSEVTREEAVIGVNVIRADGTSITSGYYKDFVSGWDFAMDHAVANSGYDRIIVDFYGDWNVVRGLLGGAVEIPEYAKVTLNMNGHTINAGLVGDGLNGEVMYIGVGADVIINDGTITGGYSNNGAGGIHIKENAIVVLNNVNVDKNATDGSNGAGIAVYDGANLTMNGGSISQNEIYGFFPYGILYVNEATATLNGVTISGNKGCDEAEGVAIYADESAVTLNNCIVSDNGTKSYSESIIGADDSTLIINNTDFINNGAVSDPLDPDYSHLFYLEDCDLTLTGGKITGNKADILIHLYRTPATIQGVTITENESVALDIINPLDKATLIECVLDKNSPVKYEEDVFVEVKGSVEFKNCELGDTTFANADNIVGLDAGVASIMGEGSFTTILLLLSLATSFAAMALTIANNKKKGALATGAEDEE